LCIGAGEQRACRIVHIDFYQQRAGGHINGLGSPHQLSPKIAPGKLSQAESSSHPGFDPLRVFLRNVDVNPQLSGLSDVEEIGFYSSTASGINEVADVSIARSDYTVE